MRIISESRKYFWDAPYLFKLDNDGVMRRCVPREEMLEILRKCHSAKYGGHYSPFRTQAKVWSSGFYWPEMHEDTKRYVASCPECQGTRNIFQRNSMALKYNLQIDFFDVWGIDFMGPFKNSHGCEHILVMVDYVSKWVEAMPCRKASTEESIAMIKSMIFPHFGTSRILIRDGGTHFTGKNFKKCLSKGLYDLSLTNQRTSKSIEYAIKKHPQQNHREGRQRLVKEIRRSFVGISNDV
jgi:hypothetical protein